MKAILDAQIRAMVLLLLSRSTTCTMLRKRGAEAVVRWIHQIIHVLIPVIILNRLHLTLVCRQVVVGYRALSLNLAASWPMVHGLVHR